ncbi:hypothetical protein ACVC7V_10465 [Hydrogenophaga sp. A37]
MIANIDFWPRWGTSAFQPQSDNRMPDGMAQDEGKYFGRLPARDGQAPAKVVAP